MTLARRIVQEKRRLVLPIALALAANVIVFAAAVVPLSRKVDNARLRAASAVGSLQQARAQHQAAEAVVTGKVRADEQLQRFYREILPTDWTAARRITYLRLVQVAERHGLRVERSGAEPQANRESVLTRLQMTMQLTGDYRNIRSFIYELERAPEFVVIENVALAQAQESATELVLTIEVSTYYWGGADGA